MPQHTATTRHASRSRAARVIPVITGAALLLTPGLASANTIAVTSTADAGAGTLRAAVAAAGTGDTITLPAGTITLTGGTISASGKDLTLQGQGARSTIISGNHASGILSTDAKLSLSAMTLRDGSSTNGGAVYTTNELHIDEVAMTGNHASSGGGAIASNGGGTTITRSLFSGNTATGTGGVATFVAQPTVTITNSTFANNSTDGHGGVWASFNSIPAPTVTMVGDTFVGNRALPGADNGPVWRTGSNTTAHYRNSLFADNGDACEQGGSAFNVSDGNNVFDGTPHSECHVIASDKVVVDAKLGSLGNHGGPTDTILPLPSSVAVDAGNAAFCPLVDQRGVSRPFGAGCDIGAVELATPGASTGLPTGVSATTATLNGITDSRGLGSVTWHFEWGPTAAYGNLTPGGTTNATSPIGISEALTGLPPATTIHYRLIATTPDGTTTTPDATVSTSATPTPAPTPTPTPGPTGKTAKTCKVPTTKGLTPGKARTAIRKAHCTVGKVKLVKSTSVKVGRVISSSPKAGKTIPRTTPVDLRVAKR